ncbi:hypothetical protein [Spirosoma flavum]|uniref:DUF2147 domain-containing protein n=1 Tax=Spirosoma flavum TaxID=2048557 RepID=A0ABW6AH91_9BACT
MKKLLFTGLVLCVLTTPVLSQSKTVRPRSSLSKDIIGVWALVDKSTSKVSAGNRLKLIVDRHWSLTQADSVSHVTTVHHGGTYTLTDSIYSERVEYANPNTARYIDTIAKFSIQIKGNSMYLKGIDNPWNEIWKRIR